MKRYHLTSKPRTITIGRPTAVQNLSGTGASIFLSSDAALVSAGALLQGQVLLAGDGVRLDAGEYTVGCADGGTATLVVHS